MDSAGPSFDVPPPLPKKAVESARHTYLRAAALLFPTLFFLTFSSLVLVPKLEKTWELAGVSVKKADWLLNASTCIPMYMPFSSGIVVLLAVGMEKLIPRFAQRRAVTVSVFVIIINFIMMSVLTGMATAALLVAPMIGKDHRAPPDANTLPKRYQRLEGSQK